MAKILHLSKLSRGHVEVSDSGSRLEIFADQTVRSYFCCLRTKKRDSFYIRKDHLLVLQKIIYQKHIQQSNKKQIISKSRYFDCWVFFLINRRGPLILFAETGLLKKSRAKFHRDKRISNPVSLISPPPLKFGELKRSILAYGGTPEVEIKLSVCFYLSNKSNFRINLLMVLLMKMEHLSI